MFEFEEENLFSILTFILGFTYGLLAQRKQFCFSGGIKDIILFDHKKRTISLIVAILTAILSTQFLSYTYGIDLTQSRYYLNINYIFIIIGGLMFGYGMMISDGCSSRHLIKIAQGEKDSFFILLPLAIFAYITYSLFLHYDTFIYTNSIISSTTSSDIIKISLYIPVVILGYILYKNLKRVKDLLQCWDGLLIGILISFGWFLTTVVPQEWFVLISPQSFSFVYPLGKIIEYISSGFESSYIIFSTIIVFGVLAGAFISSLFNKKYSKKLMCDNSQQNPPKLWQKMVGGAFMGVGGILAVGCTVGQGLSGVSTLSIASFIAIISIYISAFVTAKYMKRNNALVACFIFDFNE